MAFTNPLKTATALRIGMYLRDTDITHEERADILISLLGGVLNQLARENRVNYVAEVNKARDQLIFDFDKVHGTKQLFDDLKMAQPGQDSKDVVDDIIKKFTQTTPKSE